MIKAPWTEDQVEALNKFQTTTRFHPFTCPNHHNNPYGDRNLVATTNGWICKNCNYTQDWAHGFMTQT